MTTSQPAAGGVLRSFFDSDDESAVVEHISSMYAEARPTFAPVRDGASFRARHHDVPSLGVDRVRVTMGYTGDFPSGFDDLVVYLLHGGAVRMSGTA